MSIVVRIPEDTAESISRMKKQTGEDDVDIVRRAVDWLEAYTIIGQIAGLDELRLNYAEFRSAGIAGLQMRDAGWDDDKISATCRALFCEQTDADMAEAFRYFDTNVNGTIDRKELEEALPLMGENVPDEKLDELFALVDKDGNGRISVEEFGELVRGMNPKESGGFNPFATFKLAGAGSAAWNMFSTPATAVGSTFSALGAAWQADLASLGPIEMRKAGVVINKMKDAGYSEEMAQTVVRALFFRSEEDMKKAFNFYDKDDSGVLEIEEFRDALPLMGEDVPPEMIEEAFNKADVAGSGTIDFDEFKALLQQMNPEPEVHDKEAAQSGGYTSGQQGESETEGGMYQSALAWWNR